jgi:hypothetical protein
MAALQRCRGGRRARSHVRRYRYDNASQPLNAATAMPAPPHMASARRYPLRRSATTAARTQSAAKAWGLAIPSRCSATRGPGGLPLTWVVMYGNRAAKLPR